MLYWDLYFSIFHCEKFNDRKKKWMVALPAAPYIVTPHKWNPVYNTWWQLHLFLSFSCCRHFFLDRPTLVIILSLRVRHVVFRTNTRNAAKMCRRYAGTGPMRCVRLTRDRYPVKLGMPNIPSQSAAVVWTVFVSRRYSDPFGLSRF